MLSISWQVDTSEPTISLVLVHNGQDIVLINQGKNTGSFIWNVPENLPSGTYTLEIGVGKHPPRVSSRISFPYPLRVAFIFLASSLPAIPPQDALFSFFVNMSNTYVGAPGSLTDSSTSSSFKIQPCMTCSSVPSTAIYTPTNSESVLKTASAKTTPTTTVKGENVKAGAPAATSGSSGSSGAASITASTAGVSGSTTANASAAAGKTSGAQKVGSWTGVMAVVGGLWVVGVVLV